MTKPTAKSTTKGKKSAAIKRTYDALPDTVDFRDAAYVPTLRHVPQASDLDAYRAHKIPVLNQGTEGACTGFGLATVANYLIRARGLQPKADEVSAWMLYTMAKRYDEWPGEDYSGSSARGAMKGWHKHGLCAMRLWKDRDPDVSQEEERAANAIERPLGAYFRVNHKDLVAMHAAITEVGILYATARVHTGWQDVQPGHKAIVYQDNIIGGHAFAIVGYNREGFWIQNSWGKSWGSGGLVLLSYADWLANGTDVWVAALGVPVTLGMPKAPALMRANAPHALESNVYAALRPHIVTARNDGVLDDKGDFGLTPLGLANIITERMPSRMAAWPVKRVAVYAHGGLVSEDSAVQAVANNREDALAAQVWPISIIWRSDAWTTIGNIIRDAMAGRRDEGLLGRVWDAVLDRIDDTIEPLARRLGGKMLWDEMKENALATSTAANGAARMAADHLVDMLQKRKIDEIHLVGHSAGSILLAPLARHLAAGNVTIASVSLWAPACTIALFEEYYRPLIEDGSIAAFDLYTLDDETEQADDCANIYHKSLLYLVSAAFEATARIPWDPQKQGVPLLGLERDVKKHLAGFWNGPTRRWYQAPATGGETKARHHGDFDNDIATLKTTLARILAGAPVPPSMPQPHEQNAAQKRTRRLELDRAFARMP